MKKRIEIISLYILSFIASICPVLIYFLINFERYTKTVPETIKLCFGGALMLIFVLLKVIGKLKLPSRSALFAIVFLLSYLLQAILDDLLVFSFLALVGEVLDMTISIPIRKIKEKIKVDKISGATAKKVEDIMQKYYRGENNEV